MSAARGMAARASVWTTGQNQVRQQQSKAAADNAEDQAFDEQSGLQDGRDPHPWRPESQVPFRGPIANEQQVGDVGRRRSARRTRTATSSVMSDDRDDPTICSCKETTTADSSALLSGYCLASRSEIVRISRSACASVTPGFKRATTPRLCPPRLRFEGLSAIGRQYSVVRDG
jgi:hypothetical protein